MSPSFALLSLPNSGSTWLANQIAAHSSWDKYSMEFFNPLRNPKHYITLLPHFGCELISCYSNIARGETRGVDEAIRATWSGAGLNFTKEVFSPFKLPVFVRQFRCAVLLRRVEDSFPPDRARIWSFYEHAWYALREIGDDVKGISVEERARAAFRRMAEQLRQDARNLGVPVIEYRDLFDDARVRPVLLSALGECSEELAAAIITTRKLKDR